MIGSTGRSGTEDSGGVRLGVVPTIHFREGLLARSKRLGLALGLSPTTKQKPPFLEKERSAMAP